MIPTPSGSAEEQLRELRVRMARVEEALRARGILHEPEAAPAAGAPDQSTLPARVSPPATAAFPERTPPPPAFAAPWLPSFTSVKPAPARVADAPSLESRIGSQWFNRIGILAVLIGVAWFLKLAFDNRWIGPLGRVLIGLLAGAALIGWSERFQRRGFAAFAYSLKAIGSGTLYLSLWAAFSLYALLPAGAAFAAMILVTAFNGFMSWRQDAELLALYAVAGGLSTPLLVSTGENHEAALFTYLLILDLAVLVLVVLRPWSRLLFVSFVGTVLFVLGWWSVFYTQEQAGRTAFFLACFFLVFALAPRLAHISVNQHGGSPAWDHLALVVLPIANAGLGFIAFYNLFAPSVVDWASPWLAVAFAAFYLLLLRLPARGRLRASPALLSGLHLAAAVVFLTIAIPLKTHGRWLTIGWLVEGAALLWLAGRLGKQLLQALALVCLALGLMALLAVNPAVVTVPVFNQRFATYAAGIAVFVFVAWVAQKAPAQKHGVPIIPWASLAALSIPLVNGLILLAIGWEIHSYWWYLRWRGDWNLMHDYSMYAQFTYSAWFMIFGALLLAAGFWRRSHFLRWQALVLLVATVGKVFLSDVSTLSQGFRILSFLGLGALLLAVSFVYQRDWLHLRGHGEGAS